MNQCGRKWENLQFEHMLRKNNKVTSIRLKKNAIVFSSKNFNFTVEIKESEKEKLFAYRLIFFKWMILKTQVKAFSQNHSASDSFIIVQVLEKVPSPLSAGCDYLFNMLAE